MSTDIWVGVAIAAATLIGWALCIRLLPATLSRLALVFAAATGLGLCSLLYVLFRRPLLTVETLLVIAAVVLLYRRRVELLSTHSSRNGFLALVFAAAIAFAVFTATIRIDRLPHGEWDGWAIWNTHARVLDSTGADWINQLRTTYHGDYPLLTPALTARFWKYSESRFVEAGALLGVILGLSAVAVLVGVLSELRGQRVALVMGFALISTPLFLEHIGSQYADAPLSFYNLMTVALICLHAERAPSNKSMLALAGFAAGCAGWTKNEGLLFIAAVSAVLLLQVILKRAKLTDRLLPFAAGLLLPLAVIAFFKLNVAVPSDLIVSQSLDSVMKRVTDTERYTLTSKYWLETFWNFGAWSITPFIPLFVFVGFRGVDRAVFRNAGWQAALLVLATVLVGYFFVYINTPLDLKYHLDSSLNRLFLHLWPSFLLCIGMCARSDSRPGTVT